MYFYNSLLLISNLLILTVQTQTQTAKGPGQSACCYSNFVDKNCDIPFVDLTNIPNECTSIFVDGVYVDLNYHIAADHLNPKMNKILLDNLDKILKSSSKPVYLYYGYNSQAQWIQVLACEASNGGINSLDEMKSLKAFLKEHPGITGVILTTLENDEYSNEFPGFSENLKKHIEVMKTSIPDLEVGIQFFGQVIINQYTDPQIPWLDLAVIEPVTDFFIINVSVINNCIASLYNSGTTPMKSSTTIYTMENLKCILPELSIPKEKLYFKYRLNPTSDVNYAISYCDLTIQEMCKNPSNTTFYCSDTMESFYEKGQFAFNNGVGFITDNIEFNDPENTCKCEKPFGSFYALLSGFKSGIAKPCELFSCRQ